MKNVTRRSLLASVPAVGLVPATVASAREESQIIRLFREWKTLYCDYSDVSYDEEIANGVFDRMVVLEQQIVEIPARTVLDFAIKLILETSFGDCSLSDLGSGGLLDESLSLLKQERLSA